MSKHRIVKSDFWVDEYIENLQPKERYFFLYLLTNPNTNILGIYQVTLRRMSFETRLEEKEIENILLKFKNDDKVHHVCNFIIMVNFQKHQSPNDTMKTGIKKLINSLPDSVIDFIYTKKSKVYDRLTIRSIYLHKDRDKDISISKDKSTGNNLPIPAPNAQNYQLKKSTIKWADKKGITEEQLNKVKETCFTWHGSKGNHYTDWDKVLQTWINKNNEEKNGNGNKPKNPMPDGIK